MSTKSNVVEPPICKTVFDSLTPSVPSSLNTRSFLSPYYTSIELTIFLLYQWLFNQNESTKIFNFIMILDSRSHRNCHIVDIEPNANQLTSFWTKNPNDFFTPLYSVFRYYISYFPSSCS